jgi:hypothetical protein
MPRGNDTTSSSAAFVALLLLLVGVARIFYAREFANAQPREQVTVGTICAFYGGLGAKHCYTFAVDGKEHSGYFYPFMGENYKESKGLIQGHQISVYFDPDDPALSSPVEFGARSAAYYRDSVRLFMAAFLLLVIAFVFR